MKRWALAVTVWPAVHLAILSVAVLTLSTEWPQASGSLVLAQAASGEAPGLPDDWRMRKFQGPSMHYRFSLHLAKAPDEPWALLITSVRHRAQAAVNGHALVNLETEPADPNYRTGFRPLFYAVPTGLLSDGNNVVEIRVSAERGRGYLATPLAGPYTVLAPLARRHLVWRQTLLQFIVVAMVATGLLMLVLWLQRRTEPVYGLFGLGMLLWAAHDLEFIVSRPFLPGRYWEALSLLALGGFIACTTAFIHRFVGEPRPRTERAVVLFVLAGAPALLLLPGDAFRVFAEYVWHPLITAVGLYLYLLISMAAWRRGSAALHLLAVSGSVMVVFGAHDLLIVLGQRPWGNGYLLPYSAAPSLIVFSSLLVRRFARNLDAMEAITRDLDQRVQAATEAVRTSAAKLRDLERERWLATERERVARDIHDGVGGQLVSLLARINSGPLAPRAAADALAHALHDLSLVIQSLDVAEGDLGTAIASWRHRLERRLDGSGLRLAWKPADVPRLPGCGPSAILNVLRLLDEAATNAIRHAGAATLVVEYGMVADEFFVFIGDDGHGGAEVSASGRGILNMRRRAQDLGARFLIESGTDGTTVRLWLPTAGARL